jgi:hypothetical protein
MVTAIVYSAVEHVYCGTLATVKAFLGDTLYDRRVLTQLPQQRTVSGSWYQQNRARDFKYATQPFAVLGGEVSPALCSPAWAAAAPGKDKNRANSQVIQSA